MPNEQAESARLVREAIAARVRGAMAEHQKTQRQIGDLLGLPQSSVSLRITGERAWRAEELVALAEFLGVSIDRFVPHVITEAGAA